MTIFMMNNCTLINLAAVSSVFKFASTDYLMKMVNGNTFRLSQKEYDKLVFLIHKDLLNDRDAAHN